MHWHSHRFHRSASSQRLSRTPVRSSSTLILKPHMFVRIRVTGHIGAPMICEVNVPHWTTILVKLPRLWVTTPPPIFSPKLSVRVLAIRDRISVLVTGQRSVWEPIPTIVVHEYGRRAGHHIVRVQVTYREVEHVALARE